MNNRPSSISVIAWILVAMGGLSLIDTTATAWVSNPANHEIMRRNHISFSAQYIHIVMAYLGSLIMMLSGVAMLKGFNWARLLYVIWGIVAVFVRFITPPCNGAIIPNDVLFLIIAFFLFRPKANAFFSPVNLSNMKPCFWTGYNLIFGVLVLGSLALAASFFWRWFYIDLIIKNYEIIAAFILILAYAGVRFLPHSASRRFSYMAIFAAMTVFLNPVAIHYIQLSLHSPFAVAIGVGRLHSFAAGILSLVTGIIAVVRIARSHRTLRGLPFAIVGIIGGAIWAGFWAQLYLRFMSAMLAY